MSDNSLSVIERDIQGTRETFLALRPDASIQFEAEARFAIQTLSANEYALSVAMRNRQSVINAVTNIAAIGISLNPARKQAYLVPRDGRICLDISYMGLMDLAMQSGAIKWAQCALVYEADEFALDGLDKQPRHKFNPFAKDRGALVGVYATVKTIDGDYLTHTMAIDDVFAIRDKSQAWIAFQAKKTRSCIWVDHEGEMVRKTCIKQAYKYWPKGEQSGRLETAIHYMNTEAGEGLPTSEPRKSYRASGTDGAMEALSIELQNTLRELAGEAIDIFKDAGAAPALDMIKAAAFDSECTVAFWTLLPSDMRAALKTEAKARDDAAKVISAT